uniref:TSC22 domain family protein 1 n=1 Tax=Callorhinchus milii TaxID=7868 RepID=A0A4W3IIY3_CALMI
MAHPPYPRRSSSSSSSAAAAASLPATAGAGLTSAPGSSASLSSLIGGAGAGLPHPPHAEETPAHARSSASLATASVSSPSPSPGLGSLPGGGAAPGPQLPPQSLSLHPQPPPPAPPTVSVAGAQMKKKSGFQITSVTPAQNNAGSNNSIAEDTESYDDMDESHTEDLSSSEILDVSRATDYEPERSSSEETLNNVGDAETPGALSPNQPRLPQHQTALFNGSIHSLHPPQHHHPPHHHQHQQQQHHHHHAMVAGPGLVGTANAASGGVIASANVSAPTASEKNGIHVPVSGLVTSAVGTPAPPTSNISTTGNGNASAASGPGSAHLGNIALTSSAKMNVTGASSSVNVTAVSASSNVNASSTSAAGGPGSAVSQPAAGSSRFRVVKLDSSTEPYKKGRWVCTEFYDKENTTVVSEGISMNRTVESVKQTPTDVNLEKESTSGGSSSVSSTVSTIGYYIENAGNGDPGLTLAPQQQAFQGFSNQQLDFSSAVPHSVQPLPQSVSQPQLAQMQLHSQETMHSQQKPSAPLSGQTNISNVANVQQASIQQQLPYPQQQQASQVMPVVPQQQLPYLQQQPASQMTAKHTISANTSAIISDYVQHTQIQSSVQAMQQGAGGVGPGAPSGQTQVVQGQAPPMSAQTLPAVAPSQPVGQLSTMLLPGAANGQLVTGQQGNTISLLQQSCTPPVVNQSASTVLQSSTPQPCPGQQIGQPQQSGIVQQQVVPGSASGLVQQVVMAPQKQQLPSQPQGQGAESVIQSVNNQQITGISSTPSAVTANLPSVNQVGSSVPPNLPTVPASVIPQQPTTQIALVQNGSLIQNVSQSSIPTNVLQGGPQPQVVPGNVQYPTQASVQPQINQMEDVRRPADQHVMIAHFGESALSAASYLAQEIASGANPASLLPLKTLPLSMQPVDGEDDR